MNKRAIVAVLLVAAFAFALGCYAFRHSSVVATALLERRDIPLTTDSVTAAIRAHDAEVMELLVRAGVSIFDRDSTGEFPLITAARLRNAEALGILLPRLTWLEATDSEGRTALGLAILREDWETAEALVAAGASVDVELAEECPAIVEAAVAGHARLVTFLLEHGADVNVRDGEGFAPLSHALLRRDVALVERLLNAGADANVRDGRGNPGVLVAARQRNLAALKLLAAHGAELDPALDDAMSPLAVAVSGNDRETVEFLLEKGVVPDEDHERFYPLLLAAVQRGNAAMATTLALGGASLEAEDPTGETAFGAAIGRGDEDSFFALLNAGVSYQPFVWRIFDTGNEKFIAAIMEREFDLEARNEEGETVLARQVRLHRFDLAERLLEAGADAKAACREGHPVLVWALAFRDLELARTLLERGADANAAMASPVSSELRDLLQHDVLSYYLRNDSRITPLMVASGSSQEEMVRLLLKHGAKTAVYTGRHKTYPVNFAAQRKDTDIMQLLLGREPGDRTRRIVIDLSQQRARLYVNDDVYYSTQVSTGKPGYATPTGEYVVTNKYRHWTSTIYDSSMPYFMRLSCGSFGLHEGYVPNYPASHGCIRVPGGSARKLFSLMEVGDLVSIVR